MNPLVSSYLTALERKPQYAKYESHQWADYIELLCLANIDGQVSIEDVIDRLENRERDLRESVPEDLEHLDGLIKDQVTATNRSRISDEWQGHLQDYFRVLQYRSAAYSDDYPFIVTEKEIYSKNKSLNIRQLLYVYLLLCSNLYLLDPSSRSKFSSYFEILCFNALKNMMPTSAKVIHFGTGPLNRGQFSGKTTFYKKVVELASELNEMIGGHFSEDGYSKRDRGEDGLDLVVAIPTGDKTSSSLIFLGQCACTTEWVSKQADSSYEAWSPKIDFLNRTSNIILIPFCFRSATGNWVRPADIRTSFLVDRQRLLYQLKSIKKLDPAECFKIVREIVQTKESIV